MPPSSGHRARADLDLGTGAMREMEELAGTRITVSRPVESGVWRMANLVVAASSLTENVDLTVRNEWRHGSRPPEAVDRDDFVFETGFTVSFRLD